jgi:lipopolysaccharide export system protein LptC
MIFRIFASLALVALIAGSILLGRQQSAQTPQRTPPPTQDLGYGARDAQLIETGPDGRPKYTLNAKSIEQHASDDRVELHTVHMIVNDEAGNRWTVDAQRGDIAHAGENIELSGDVHIDGTLPGTGAPADISSERVSLNTRTNVVTSDDPVTLAWGTNRQIHTVGIMANLKDSHVRLESKVHGIFQP